LKHDVPHVGRYDIPVVIDVGETAEVLEIDLKPVRIIVFG
jgi:hypothetical protein